MEAVGSNILYFQPAASGTQGRAFGGVADGHRGPEVLYDTATRHAIGAPVQVVIEPDADHDGFGDETQDQCVGAPGTLDGCKPGTISGTVESGAGAMVYIDANANGALDADERSATADSAGAYLLDQLRPGTYAVRVQPLAMTTCDPGCQQSVTVKGDSTTVDFHLFAAPTTAPGDAPPPLGASPPVLSTAPTARDTTAPVLSPLTLAHKRFAVNRAGAVLAKAKPAKGTTLKFTSSEAGTATFTISSVRPGRKAGKRCLAPGRRRIAPSKRCSRVSPVAGFTTAATSGANAVRFAGRVRLGAATKSLSTGSYRITLSIRDAAGNRSNTVAARFTVVR